MFKARFERDRMRRRETPCNSGPRNARVPSRRMAFGCYAAHQSTTGGFMTLPPKNSIWSARDVAALRTISLFEAAKALLALALAAGAVSLLRHGIYLAATDLVLDLGLDPSGGVAHALMGIATRLERVRATWVIAAAIAYAALRFAESWGLWHERAWGEWIGALSGVAYLPFEIRGVILSQTWPRIFLLTANLVVVFYLAFHLWRRRHPRLIGQSLLPGPGDDR